MGKFEDLQKIQELKENGSITDKEFEIEKYKILNSVDNNKESAEGIYIASLVLGICSLLLGIIPVIGLILSIVALIISIKSRNKLKIKNEKSGLVTAGFILSIIGLLFAIFSSLRVIFVIINLTSSPI